jgi:hypothetical protein
LKQHARRQRRACCISINWPHQTKKRRKWFHLTGPVFIESPGFFLFSDAARLHTGMKMMKFSKWLARRDEGFLLPDRPPLKGMPKINAFPTTDGHRRRLHVKPAKKPKPFAPTVRAVKEIVPNKLIPKLKPTPPSPPLH